jgi:hypothetical protein
VTAAVLTDGDIGHAVPLTVEGTARYRASATSTFPSDLYVSVTNALGVPLTSFGDPATCKGPLPGVG